jgi:hypothetical protein
VTSESEFVIALRFNIAYIRKKLSHINSCHTENYYRIKSNFFQGSYTHSLIAEYNSLHPAVNVYPEFRINRIYKTIQLSCFQQKKPTREITPSQIPCIGTPWLLNFLEWHLLFVNINFGASFMSHFWRLEFLGASWSFGTLVQL